MKPSQLMWTGLLVLVVSVTAEVMSADIGSLAVFAFGGGMVFGKGYGVWEERCRRRAQS